ncbi:MAG: NYN domain-containing protein [bacterium]|nr:NYN domain-containing protein [bacterium]
MATTLFIDSENFKNKLKVVFEKEGKERPLWYEYNFGGLLDQVLKNIPIDKKIFYTARLGNHPLSQEKSKQLIEEQRLMKKSLESNGFQFVYGGRVRGNVVSENGKERVIFKEKGVDVRMAVDMVEAAYEGALKVAIIGSSDSDLQPAIKILKRRGVECIYLGFELDPNKGLLYTTNRGILIRNSEVLNYLSPKLSVG